MFLDSGLETLIRDLRPARSWPVGADAKMIRGVEMGGGIMEQINTHMQTCTLVPNGPQKARTETLNTPAASG